MLVIEFVPLASYALIASFTPGPATIASSSLGVLHGLQRTWPFQAGLMLGVFLMMLLGGLVSASLLSWFPMLEPVLRYLGAAYILYLAWNILHASYKFSEGETKPLGFAHGLVLNLSNPKLVVYAFTVFSSFLSSVTGSVVGLVAAAFLLSLVSAASTVTWTLFGAAIRNRLRDPRFARWINIGLALALVYAAVELTGVLAVLG
jgi:cysteine/O-acetylserine efflux protein